VAGISPPCSDRGPECVDVHLHLPHSPRRVTRNAASETVSQTVFLQLRIGKYSFALLCTKKQAHCLYISRAWERPWPGKQGISLCYVSIVGHVYLDARFKIFYSRT
jgi:hypothetical protein